jgi:hypothetical protein
MVKMKLTARLTEAETAADNLNAKLGSISKLKDVLGFWRISWIC